MQGQTIITTHDVDELFISTVVRLIQRRAFPNLRNIIAKTHSADIARWFPHLRTEAKTSLFKVLIEEKRMGRSYGISTVPISANSLKKQIHLSLQVSCTRCLQMM
jgi:hypothetical protein